MKPMTILIARHATPDWTRTDLVYHLPPGPPLTELGLIEAQALGEFFKQSGVQHIFSSPLERCRRTATVAAQEADATVQVMDELMEMQPGETHHHLLDRLRPVLQQVEERAQNGIPPAIVTHGAPVGALLEMLGMDPGEVRSHCTFDHKNPLPPAGVWQASRASVTQAWSLNMAFIPEPV